MNKKLIRLSTLSIFTSAVFFTSTSFANEESGIYKWVDSRGVTNYSETPPDAKDAKAQSLNINRYVPRGSEEAINNLQKQRTEKAEAEKEAKSGKEGVKKTGEKAKADVSKASAANKEKCATLKDDLTKLGAANSTIKVKDANGEIRKMTLDEITKRTESTKSQIKIYCE